jgi:hypothetical protein
MGNGLVGGAEPAACPATAGAVGLASVNCVGATTMLCRCSALPDVRVVFAGGTRRRAAPRSARLPKTNADPWLGHPPWAPIGVR